MKVGILFVSTDYSADIAVVAKRLEEMGFESLWAPEHTVLPVETFDRYKDTENGPVPKFYADMADPFVSLGRASAVTTTLKLGTAVCLVPEHNPLLLAKQVASLDMWSKGRVLFGIGAGWNAQETEIMGGDFDHRWTQTKDAILAMKQLWTAARSEYHGEYYDFPPVYSFPRPAQRPHPPVLLGGAAKNVFKRVVAWGDGWMPFGSPETVAQGRATLNELAREAGRDPMSIEISVCTPRVDMALIEQYEAAGADRVIVAVEPKAEAETMVEFERIADGALR